ncbi:MAG TPA: hypothetical protein VEL75_21265, partial [Candidatus Methylomirabilis sp.]|nr:hypothetical protein [Candidatus Methylomirabilis sp.]
RITAVATREKATLGTSQRLLFVVARSRFAFYQQLVRGFENSDHVEAVLDRRMGERRTGPSAPPVERRRRERRAAPRDAQLESPGWFMAWRTAAPTPAEDAIDPDSGPSSRPSRRPMERPLLPPLDGPPLSHRDRRGIEEMGTRVAAGHRGFAGDRAPARRGRRPVVAGLVIGVLIAGLASYGFLLLMRRAPVAPTRSAVAVAPPEPQRPPAEVAPSPPPPPAPAAPAEQAAPPTAAPAPPGELPGRASPATVAPAASSKTAPASPPAAPAAPSASERELRAALQSWVDTANRRQMAAHVEWYADPVAVFYDGRNLSRSAVLKLRSATLKDAGKAEVRISEPEIRLGADDHTATMVFRKTYVSQAPGGARRSAILQELRWKKTDAGWRIVSERAL